MIVRRRWRVVAVAVLAGVLLAAGGTRLSSASFTAAQAISGNTLTVDSLGSYFEVTPGSAVQAGTSTPIAAGGVDDLALALGFVPSARTFTDVFVVRNVTALPQTAVLTQGGASQVESAVFEATGTGSVTLAPGASTSVSVTTSSTVAGRGAGSLRLRLAGLTWLYRDYDLSIDAAPEAPAWTSASPKPAGRIDVAWAASMTTNLAGYDLYRSSGAGYVKLNTTPLSGTTYSDTATSDGIAYTYKVRSISSGSPSFESVDSGTVSATADASAPGAPTAVSLANGGGAGNAYVNLANRASVSVSVTLPAGSAASDVVTVQLTNGPQTVAGTTLAPNGAGTVTVTGIDATILGDGTITITAFSTDLAGNVSGNGTGSAPKDTVAPGAPSATYTDNNNTTPDVISGTAEAGSTVTATRTVPSAAGPYTTTAAGNGSYSVNVAAVNGKPNAPIPVTYLVTATDAAGNASAATTLNYNVTK